MTYSRSPFDNQYGLDEWIRQQAESAPLDALAAPDSGLSAPPPMAAFQPPPHADMAPLQLNTGPDWSDALGVGTTALASLADLALNHGRGTGQILAAGGQFGQARAEQRLRGTQDALAYEEKRAQLDKSNRYNDYLFANMAQRGQNQQTIAQQRGQNIDLRARDVGVKEANSGRADAKVTRDTNAASDYAQQFRDWATERGLAQPGDLDKMSYEQMKSANPALLKAWEFDHTGDKAQAARTGTIAADLAAAPDTTAVAADRAGKVAAAEAPYKVSVAEGSAAARERGQQTGKEQASAGLSIPGLIETDPQAATRSKSDPTTLRKIQDSGGALAAARSALQDMAALRKQYGTELPGEAKTRFDMAQVSINGALTELGRTGVLSDKERAYYMSMIPDLSLGWTDALRPGGVDIKQKQLAGALQEFGNLANGKLRAYGYGLDTGSGRPQPSAAGPANYGPDAGHPSNLGVTGSVPTFRATPGGGAATARGDAVGPVGGMASGSTGGGTLLLPSGRPAPGTLTPEQIQAVLAAGGHWQ